MYYLYSVGCLNFLAGNVLIEIVFFKKAVLFYRCLTVS